MIQLRYESTMICGSTLQIYYVRVDRPREDYMQSCDKAATLNDLKLRIYNNRRQVKQISHSGKKVKISFHAFGLVCVKISTRYSCN